MSHAAGGGDNCCTVTHCHQSIDFISEPHYQSQYIVCCAGDHPYVVNIMQYNQPIIITAFWDQNRGRCDICESPIELIYVCNVAP